MYEKFNHASVLIVSSSWSRKVYWQNLTAYTTCGASRPNSFKMQKRVHRPGPDAPLKVFVKKITEKNLKELIN